MRILQVCAVDFTALHFLRPLMRACREQGWQVEFACADGPGVRILRDEGFVYRHVPMRRSVAPLQQARAAWVLAASLRRDPPDLVHTHTPVGGMVGRAAAILARQRRIVHTFHGLPFREGPVSLTDRAFLVIERLLAARTTYFFSQAEGDVDHAVGLRIARPGDVLVIGNGVDTERFAPDPLAREEVRAALGVPSGGVLVVIMARLVREKGVLEFADAAMRLQRRGDLHFALVGDALASDRTAVVSELDAHAVTGALGPRWKRLGYRPDADRILKAADIFVLPSYREGLPRSVIEAMACALPIVASDIPACRELVDGENGVLVPARESLPLADAIGVLAGSPELRRRMGARGRERAVARHDERTVLRRQIGVLRQLAPS